MVCMVAKVGFDSCDRDVSCELQVAGYWFAANAQPVTRNLQAHHANMQKGMNYPGPVQKPVRLC